MFDYWNAYFLDSVLVETFLHYLNQIMRYVGDSNKNTQYRNYWTMFNTAMYFKYISFSVLKKIYIFFKAGTEVCQAKL